MRPESTSGPTRWSLNSNEVTTPKLPPPPRWAWYQVGLGAGLFLHQPAIGHHVGRDEVVDGQAELAAQPAEAAAERQPGDAGGGIDAEGRGEPEGLRLAIEVPSVSRFRRALR